jgi:hypothetical protein
VRRTPGTAPNSESGVQNQPVAKVAVWVSCARAASITMIMFILY